MSPDAIHPISSAALRQWSVTRMRRMSLVGVFSRSLRPLLGVDI